MAAPQSSRYPRPLRATHLFTSASAASPQQQQTTTTSGSHLLATSPPSPGASGAGKKTGWAPSSPESPPQPAGRDRAPVLVPVHGGGDEEGEEEEEEVAMDGQRRRANSLTSLADSNCCYGNSLWQHGAQSNPPLVREGEGVGDEEGTTVEGTKEPLLHGFFHKRSNSCSSAESLRKTAMEGAPGRRGDDAHTRKSIEGLNQEISTALEGVQIISPHQPPDGHMAPIRELLSSVIQSSPQSTNQFSPSSPHPHSSPSPLSLSTPTELPETPTGFPCPASPSLSNPSFARDPPAGIERCLTTDIKPHSSGLIPIGPDKTKAKIVFQKSSAFLPHTAVTINPVS